MIHFKLFTYKMVKCIEFEKGINSKGVRFKNTIDEV